MCACAQMQPCVQCTRVLHMHVCVCMCTCLHVYVCTYIQYIHTCVCACVQCYSFTYVSLYSTARSLLLLQRNGLVRPGWSMSWIAHAIRTAAMSHCSMPSCVQAVCAMDSKSVSKFATNTRMCCTVVGEQCLFSRHITFPFYTPYHTQLNTT